MIQVYSDGGCIGRNARDGLTYGSFKVFVDDIEVNTQYLEFGVGSNNVSEYKSLINALKYCELFGYSHPTCYIDSQLVYHQCRDEWKVKDERLKPLREEAVRRIKAIGAELVWVRRDAIVDWLGH